MENKGRAGMLFKPKGTEPVVASRARDHAHWLVRDHGDEAEAVLAAKRQRAGVSRADLYRYKLTARELKRLRKRSAASSEVTGRQQRLLSVDGLFRLLGVRQASRRK
ncbi:MAG: hypothetical protein JWL91_134 [Sphingomonas bacterium]|nr:hypothetical protein [Sphingomonas bacterium]